MPVIDIDRDTARDAAGRELARPIYPKQPPQQRIIDLAEEALRRLLSSAAEIPGGWFTITVLLVLVHGRPALAAAAVRRVAPTPPASAGPPAGQGSTPGPGPRPGRACGSGMLHYR